MSRSWLRCSLSVIRQTATTHSSAKCTYSFYEDGDTNGCEENEPESFLYGFIIHAQGIDAFITKDDFPVDERFITNEWVYLDEDYHDEDLDTDALIDIDEVPWDYKEQFGEPDIVGRNYELKIPRC